MSLQQEIIEALGVKPVIDPQQEVRVSVDFLKSYLKANPFLKTLVLGISGGQDSTLTGILSQTAIRELREETGDKDYTFIAVRCRMACRPMSRIVRMRWRLSSRIAPWS
jgi:NH(3)-dependent NAD(+) synthetase (EC 6.3.1.5)